MRRAGLLAILLAACAGSPAVPPDPLPPAPADDDGGTPPDDDLPPPPDARRAATDGGAMMAAAASDAGVAAADGARAPGCPGLVCEDFERGALDRTLWTSVSGSVAVQSDVVHAGKYAVRVRLGAAGSARIGETRTYPAITDQYWGRAYFYLTPALPWVHSVFVTGGPADGPHLELGGARARTATAPTGSWQLSRWPDFENRYGHIRSGGLVPVDQWICVEWRMTIQPTRSVVVYVDGKLNARFDNIPDVPAGETPGPTEFRTITFGLRSFQGVAVAPTDVYYDDIVLGTARIGC